MRFHDLIKKHLKVKSIYQDGHYFYNFKELLSYLDFDNPEETIKQYAQSGIMIKENGEDVGYITDLCAYVLMFINKNSFGTWFRAQAFYYALFRDMEWSDEQIKAFLENDNDFFDTGNSGGSTLLQ